MPLKIHILPSLLASDVGNLEAEARRAEAAGGDGLHIDIMDGHFVPNLSMGPTVVAMARRCVRLPLSVHLMMTNPDRHVEQFAKAGADTLLIHIEAPCPVAETLRAIRQMGVRSGITLSPDTPAEAVYPVLDDADEVLVMTVRPGYGGQAFIPEVLPKIQALRDRARSDRRSLDISVDGGIDQTTSRDAAARGANVFIAGTSLYGAADMAEAIARMRRTAEAALSK